MIGEPQSKFIKRNHYPLMELRPMPERIFYSPCGIQRFVLLHHYTKRQNKTNVREIRKAINNLEDWIKRKKEEIYGNLE